jgi:Mitochondrial carrier protein
MDVDCVSIVVFPIDLSANNFERPTIFMSNGLRTLKFNLLYKNFYFTNRNYCLSFILLVGSSAQRPPAWQEACAGAVSGVVTRMIIAPLDVVKIR